MAEAMTKEQPRATPTAMNERQFSSEASTAEKEDIFSEKEVATLSGISPVSCPLA